MKVMKTKPSGAQIDFNVMQTRGLVSNETVVLRRWGRETQKLIARFALTKG